MRKNAKKGSLFGMFLLFSCLLLAWVPSCQAEPAVIKDYFYLPTFYSTPAEAIAAIRNLQTEFIGWKGTFPQNIDVDRFGIRIAGSLNYVVSQQVWNDAFGEYETVQKPVHVEELTIIPFDRLLDLSLRYNSLLTYEPDPSKEYKWYVLAFVKDCSDLPAFRTNSRETAQILYNAIASLAWASGHPFKLKQVGASFHDITSDDLKLKDFQKLGLLEPKGMLVTAVQEESPAQAGGLKAGDVIVACNNVQVINFEQYSNEILPKAKVLNFDVIRKEGHVTVQVTPIPADQLPKPPATLTFGSDLQETASPSASAKTPKLGLGLRLPNDAEKRVSKGKAGAVVSSLTKGGLAEAAGLEVGDLLLECNGKPIPDPDGLGVLLTPGKNTFKIQRKGAIFTITIAPEVSY